MLHRNLDLAKQKQTMEHSVIDYILTTEKVTNQVIEKYCG